MNDTTIIAAIVAAIVGILTKVADVYAQRRRDRSVGSVEFRKLLSEDERAFRGAVIDEVKRLRAELAKRDSEIFQISAENTLLKAKLSQIPRVDPEL